MGDYQKNPGENSEYAGGTLFLVCILAIAMS